MVTLNGFILRITTTPTTPGVEKIKRPLTHFCLEEHGFKSLSMNFILISLREMGISKLTTARDLLKQIVPSSVFFSQLL